MNAIVIAAWESLGEPLVPVHTHDCTTCVLVAQVFTGAEGADNVVHVDDVYFCPNGGAYSTLARHSSDGPDYETWPLHSSAYTSSILRNAPDWALVVAGGLLSGRLTRKGKLQ